jgi:hypothetical protein
MREFNLHLRIRTDFHTGFCSSNEHGQLGLVM